MSRFLIVVPPLAGHVNPTLSVARELEQRGHEVAWAAHPDKVRPLLPQGAKLFALSEETSMPRFEASLDRRKDARGLAALKYLWEDFFVPLARQMTPGVESAVEAFRPDALLVDQQALAGMLVARKRALPWATSVTTSAGITDPLRVALPKVQEWLDGQLDTLQREAGLPSVAQPDRSPALVLVFSTPELVGQKSFPPHYVFVGPSIAHRPQTTPFPFEALRDDVPRVLVSLGTVSAEIGDEFYRVVIEAFTDQPIQIVLVAPDSVSAPPNFIVRSFVPQLALLPRMSAVVCHGGHNTVCETLAHGLPLVVTPIRDDQPVVAEQVESAGAGLRLKFGRLKAASLRDAVFAVLRVPSHAQAARRIRESFLSAGGAALAAQKLEQLA